MTLNSENHYQLESVKEVKLKPEEDDNIKELPSFGEDLLRVEGYLDNDQNVWQLISYKKNPEEKNNKF